MSPHPQPNFKLPEEHVDYFLPYQRRWIEDQSMLKIIEKSRQIGLSYADAYDTVLKAADIVNGMDVWVSSRDEDTALLYLDHCKRWARILNHVTEDIGVHVIDPAKDIKARVLKFPRGFRIFSLSSVPNAAVSRSGHIKLDEFAVRKEQDELYSICIACIMWGGQLSLISTHRGHNTVFNKFIRSIKEEGNPMGWSHHRVTIHDAVDQGIVERINIAAKRSEGRGAFLQRLRAQCLDEHHWLREFCCQPADDNSSVLTWDMITGCEFPGCLKSFEYLEACQNPLYCGVDVARKKHLTVIDVGEKIGDVMWDRLRIELRDAPFSEMEHELFRILELPSVKRCCIDDTGVGMQLAERAQERFGWKVEGVTFSAPLKEKIAFALRNDFEARRLRTDNSPSLRADLRGVKREVTVANNLRLVGESEDGHCDRFWAKALRQHAAEQRREFFATVIE